MNAEEQVTHILMPFWALAACVVFMWFGIYVMSSPGVGAIVITNEPVVTWFGLFGAIIFFTSLIFCVVDEQLEKEKQKRDLKKKECLKQTIKEVVMELNNK